MHIFFIFMLYFRFIQLAYYIQILSFNYYMLFSGAKLHHLEITNIIITTKRNYFIHAKLIYQQIHP